MSKETVEHVIDKLYPYQKEALDKLVNSKKALNYLDMRLGKTLVTLTAVESLEAYPTIIICPKFALYVWKQEIETWFGKPATVYSGTPKKRAEQWKTFVTEGHKYLITNYALLKDFTGETPRTAKSQPTPGTHYKWGAFVADEIHMGGLLNSKSKTFKMVDKFIKDIPVIYLLTGTPVRQGCLDLYGPLHLIHRERFKAYWQFVNNYCVTIETPFGKSIERNPANIKRFRNMLQPYMIRKTKEEVFEYLPKKQRQPVPVDMNSEQRKIYAELTEELLAIMPETGDVLAVPGALSLIMRQRQILACPQTLGLKHRGAAVDTVIDMSHEYLDDGKHIIIYTPFRGTMDILEHELKEEYSDVNIYRIQGQMTAEEFRDSWRGFQNDKKRHKVMLCIIKSGAAFKASAASAGFFIGFEWDFNLNVQAEDRMFSTEDTEAIHVYYITHNGTVEDDIKEKLNSKNFSSDWVLGSEDTFNKLVASTYKK